MTTTFLAIDRADLEEKLREGFSMRELCEHFGCSTSAIAERKRLWKLQNRSNRCNGGGPAAEFNAVRACHIGDRLMQEAGVRFPPEMKFAPQAAWIPPARQDIQEFSRTGSSAMMLDQA